MAHNKEAENFQNLDNINSVYQLKKQNNRLKALLFVFVLFIIGLSLLFGFTYSAFESKATATGITTFAINGHSGELNINYGKITKYDTSSEATTILTISPDTDYIVPSSITITMGTNPFDGFIYNPANGEISITNISVTQSPLKISGNCFHSEQTVNFNSGDSTTAGTTSAIATYGNAMPAITLPQKTGYNFLGYYTESNGGGTMYYDSNGTSQISSTLETTTTLYAHWEIIIYTITYYGEDGTTQLENLLPANYTKTYTINDTITLPTSKSDGTEITSWIAMSSAGNWQADTDYSGTQTNLYGNVSLKLKSIISANIIYNLSYTNWSATVYYYDNIFTTNTGGGLFEDEERFYSSSGSLTIENSTAINVGDTITIEWDKLGDVRICLDGYMVFYADSYDTGFDKAKSCSLTMGGESIAFAEELELIVTGDLVFSFVLEYDD